MRWMKQIDRRVSAAPMMELHLLIGNTGALNQTRDSGILPTGY
jgi:hypothetical protein